MAFSEPTRAEFAARGWQPPRPARDANGGRIETNDSGEDFLYMHRQMIVAVNKQLAQLKDPSYPRVRGWRRIPAPDDKAFPVPPAYQTGNPGLDAHIREVKSDRFYEERIRPLAERFAEEKFLRSVTLGQLGSMVEFTVHNSAHVRWSEKPTGIRPHDVAQTAAHVIDPRWDAPTYDWLGDSYSAHVSSTFWKIHGWVDDRIVAWKRANEVTGRIQWKGTWVGKAAGGHDHHERVGPSPPAPAPPVGVAPDEAEELLRAAPPDWRIASPFVG